MLAVVHWSIQTSPARHKHTHRQDRLQYIAPLASTQCKKRWLSDHSVRTVWHSCQFHLGLLNASQLTSCWALKWDDHIDAIMTKAAKRLWFLKTLKRAGVSVDNLAHYYQTVVRPVLEYACTVWHSSLSKQQAKSLEDVQRRALQIIVGNTPCRMFDIQSLADRRSELCRTLFRQIVITSPTVCTICCLQSMTPTWLAVYSRLQLIRYSVREPIDSKTHFFLIAWLIISDMIISDICVICYCMLACTCVCYSLFLSSLWLPYTINKWCM